MQERFTVRDGDEVLDVVEAETPKEAKDTVLDDRDDVRYQDLTALPAWGEKDT